MAALVLQSAACDGIVGDDGPDCVTGKRCGNTCIARWKNCHVNNDSSGGSGGQNSGANRPSTDPDEETVVIIIGGDDSSPRSDNSTNAGEPCRTESDCDGGELAPYCIPETDEDGDTEDRQQ